MILEPVIARLAVATSVASESLRRFAGRPAMTRAQRVTYEELMNLSDRQLEDIGLNRTLIATVARQGPNSLNDLKDPAAVSNARGQ